MLAKTFTSTLEGIEGQLISVEVNLSRGIPYTHIVGCTDKVVKESIERIRAALNNCGFTFPLCRVTVNLAPADLKKTGSHYDLPIAVAVLTACSGIKPVIKMDDYAFFGELSLDGKINPVRGMLPLAMAAEERGITNIVVPYGNRYEVSLLEKSNIITVKNFREVADIIEGKINEYQTEIIKEDNNYGKTDNIKAEKDFSQVFGQESVKRAMVIAAAGGHSMLMMGSPGTGKSMMAERFADILPPLSYEEQMEITKIYSTGGLMKSGKPLMSRRPFRAPHNTITPAGFFGGGKEPKPGEMSYAHKGVLFLDELQFFDNRIIQLLRIPMEEKKITITRNRRSYIFPADIILITAVNPCRCGYRGDETHICTCTPGQINQYFDKLSGPFTDRIDMHVRMNPVNYTTIENREEGMGTEIMRNAVIKGRKVQERRYKNENFSLNSQLDEEGIKKYIKLDRDCRKFVKSIYEKMGLSVRSYNRILKVALTICDINGDEKIKTEHIAEAVQYRNIAELCRGKA